MIVIDADGHMLEPDSLYIDYADPDQKDLIPATPDYGLVEANTPLGTSSRSPTLVRPTACVAADPEGGFAPLPRLADMDKDGIMQMVCFPSVVTSLCRYSVPVERAMVAAYNNWMSTFCSAAPERLFSPIVVSLRDLDFAITEIHRRLNDPAFVGVTIPTRLDGRTLADPYFDRLWQAAQDFDLPILVHSGTARPPYPIGMSEQADNFFLMHLMHHPCEQMLALASVIGGGVLDRFTTLRFGFFEAGCGWVPWYMERICEHATSLPGFVPRLRSDPRSYINDGRCFFSCDPDEASNEHFVTQLGDEALLYASDYPHWDSVFPSSVAALVDRAFDTSTLTRILSGNARRLYSRLPVT
jgi:predicted TIM-barrel fold metal-dependent hydrolase